MNAAIKLRHFQKVQADAHFQGAAQHQSDGDATLSRVRPHSPRFSPQSQSRRPEKVPDDPGLLTFHSRCPKPCREYPENFDRFGIAELTFCNAYEAYRKKDPNLETKDFVLRTGETVKVVVPKETSEFPSDLSFFEGESAKRLVHPRRAYDPRGNVINAHRISYLTPTRW